MDRERKRCFSSISQLFICSDDLLSGARQGVERAWEAVGQFYFFKPTYYPSAEKKNLFKNLLSLLQKAILQFKNLSHLIITLSLSLSFFLYAGDFFNDLEKEWGDYSKRRGGDAGGPKSLWEELADIGEELVEFLEKGAGLGPDGQPIQAKKGSSWEEEILGNNNKDKKTSSPPPRPPPQKQKQDRNSASRPPVTPPKSRKEVIDDDLEELKRKMGLK